MHLVKRLDVMANQAKDSARNVLILIETKFPEELLCQIYGIGKNLVDCATTLRICIEKLGNDPLEVKEISQRVDRIEEEVDEKYLEMKKRLLKYSKEVDPTTLMILKDLLECMEHVADTCEHTAEYIRILSVIRETA
jgi:predicted phosphate transport protein (TIGR00153 family)